MEAGVMESPGGTSYKICTFILIHSLYFPVVNGDNIRNLAQDRGHQAATERRRFKPAARTGPSDIGHNLWLLGRQSNGSEMQGEWLQFA